MLCQNCGKNEATTHVKRIINGEAAEAHLCPACAHASGYDSVFSGFGLNLSDIFGGFFGDIPVSKLSNRVIRCEKCGCSFDDIAKSGMIGCADCYSTFFDKLQPTLQRIHGNTQHAGRVPGGVHSGTSIRMNIDRLKQQLQKAVAAEEYEQAAKLRDAIRSLTAQLEQREKSIHVPPPERIEASADGEGGFFHA